MLSKRALLDLLVVILCLSGLTACAERPSARDASPPTPEPTIAPNPMPQSIVDALRSQHPKIAAYCDMVGRVVDSPHYRWEARTEDAKQEVWILECLIDREVVESTGKRVITEAAYYSLFDSTTGSVQLDRVLAQSLWGAGQYTDKELFDLNLVLRP